MKSLSRVQLLPTPWTIAYQDPPSMGFSRQEYWSGVPLPSTRLQRVRHDSMSTVHDMACPECFHIFNEFNLKEKPYELSTTTNQILRMRNLNHCECMLLSQYCRVISINQDTKRPMPTLCNTMLLCLFLLLTLNRNLHRRITG